MEAAAGARGGGRGWCWKERCARPQRARGCVGSKAQSGGARSAGRLQREAAAVAAVAAAAAALRHKRRPGRA